MKKLFAIMVSSLLSISAFAHEGHDDAPGALKAVHGGTVKAGKEMNLEFVVSGDELKLYPVGHDGKDLSAAAVKLQATAKSPKGKEAPLKLEPKDGALAGKVDFAGAYRVEVKVVANVGGKTDSFKFQVEK
jgi:hypothetical protein